MEVFTSRSIKRITSRTQAQSSNSFWYLYRRGVITGTLAKRVIAQNLENENNEKINQTITKSFPSRFANEAMLYGLKNEKNALAAFFDIFKKSHKNAKMKEIGLVLYDKFPYIGGSPDAIVLCDCCKEPFLIEAKCPFRLAETGISSWRILGYFDELQNLKREEIKLRGERYKTSFKFKTKEGIEEVTVISKKGVDGFRAMEFVNLILESGVIYVPECD